MKRQVGTLVTTVAAVQHAAVVMRWHSATDWTKETTKQAEQEVETLSNRPTAIIKWLTQKELTPFGCAFYYVIGLFNILIWMTKTFYIS